MPEPQLLGQGSYYQLLGATCIIVKILNVDLSGSQDDRTWNMFPLVEFEGMTAFRKMIVIGR